MLPFLLGRCLTNPLAFEIESKRIGLRLPGTKTITAPGVYAVARGWFRLAALINRAQGLLFNIPYRWSDDDRLKGKIFKFERSEGSSADWLNYAVTGVALKSMGHYAIIHSTETIMKKVESYYAVEPNSKWFVDMYRKALEKYN